MNPLYLSLAFLLVIAQLALPRRLGFVPLVVAAYHIGNVEFIGDFTLHRILIFTGLVRAVQGSFFQFSVNNRLDVIFLIFALVAMLTAGAHLNAGFNPYVANIGLILNVCGTYFYGRSYLCYDDWPQAFAYVTVISILPLAILMVAENISAKNYYSILGTTSSGVNIREGKIRARGPFAHSILGGTSGAVSFALCFILWKTKRKIAICGMVSCFFIVMTSSSSGPLASLMMAAFSLWFWQKRKYLKLVVWLVVLVLFAAELYMDRPFYYIISMIDLAGGSTGWHRCRLIESAFQHFSEWWLAGTDFTRHWMPTGVSWNPNHTDITNYYLHIGVIGGFFLMLTLIWIIKNSYQVLLQRQSFFKNENSEQEFIFWCLGAALFAHVTTFISVSYFDQMYVLFYLLVGGIGSLSSLFPKAYRVAKY